MAEPRKFDDTLYVTFAGDIEDVVVSRFMQVFNVAVMNGIKTVHLMLQSAGGIIPSGFALYNYMRGIPLNIIAYNGGAVASIAVIVFLAANERRATPNATFMIHKSYTGQSGLNADRLALVAKDILANDERIEAILKETLTLAPEKWEIHKFADLHITAQEAQECGLISGIGHFHAPPGCQLVNIQSSRT